MSDSLARLLVRELVGFKPEAVSASARDKATLCLLDYLSCTFAGRQMPYGEQAIEAARPWSFEAGVPVVATSLRVSPGEAAYLNSLLAASASRTDMHPASTSHPAAVIFPVAFACLLNPETRDAPYFSQTGDAPYFPESRDGPPVRNAVGRERAHAGDENASTESRVRPQLSESRVRPRFSVSGSDFLAAVIAGYEAMGRLGRIVVGSEFKKRFRATSVLGSVGGAITAARLLGLNETQAVNAVSISANAAAGLMAWGHTGEVDLFYQPANAARAAITAALLAREGATSSEAIFESAGGFFEAFGGKEHAQELTRRATDGWEIELIDYKPVPACVFVQAAAFAAKKLVDEQKVAGADVECVKLRTFAAAVAYPGCNNAGPIDAMQPARMSIQYTVASVLARSGLTDQNFSDITNPLINRLTAEVALEVTDDFTNAFPARQGAEIEVHTKQGKTMTARVDEVPEVSPARIRERFREVAQPLFSNEQITQLESNCLRCDALADAGALLANTTIDRP